MSPTTFLFLAVVLTLLVLIGSTVWSILLPERRTWPPLRRSGFMYRVTSVLGPAISFGLFAVSVFSWNSFVLDHWLRFPIGGLLLAGGGYLALGGAFMLGLERSTGHEGELQDRGPYRFTRNPQYVGAAISYVALGVICNSGPGLASAVLACAWWGLMPFAEEPWLREKLGAPYEAYAERVPRFLGLRR